MLDSVADQNSYDFILNDGKKAGKEGWPAPPPGKTRRLVLMAAGGIALVLVLAIVFALLFAGGGADRQRLLGLAQRHAEIMRVADIGIDRARSHEARNLAVTTKLSLQSSQPRLMAVVQRASEFEREELAAGHDPETDTMLETAERNNRFDEVFVQTLTAMIKEYRLEINAAHEASRSAANRQVYADIFMQLGALLPEQPVDKLRPISPTPSTP